MLAAASTAEAFGELVGALMFPFIGILLLVVGLQKRAAYERFVRAQSFRGWQGQQFNPGYTQWPQPQVPTQGTGFIVSGWILLGLCVLSALGNASSSLQQ